MRVPRFLMPLLAACLVPFAAACAGDDDDSAPPPVPTATPIVIGTPSVPGTGTAASPAAAGTTAAGRSPESFQYIVAAGDTFDSIAKALDGAPGPDGLTGADLRSLNPAVGATPAVGAALVVPLRLPPSGGLIPAAAIAGALKNASPRPAVFQPSAELIDGLQGRIALRVVELRDGAPADEAPGYRIELWSTDRAAIKGGSANPDAHLEGKLAVIAAGSFAATLTSDHAGDLYTWNEGGVPYAFKTFGRTDAAALAKLLARQ